MTGTSITCGAGGGGVSLSWSWRWAYAEFLWGLKNGQAFGAQLFVLPIGQVWRK
jgi:hypothetical protein